MTFLKEYMEEEVPKSYSVAQKRALFFRFVDFNDPNFGDELKAKVSTMGMEEMALGARLAFWEPPPFSCCAYLADC
jgi:hypothetical protein